MFKDISVLLIDDEQTFVAPLQFQIKNDFGCKTTMVLSPTQALELIKDHTYDLIITDHQMEIDDGSGRSYYFNADELVPKIKLLPNGKNAFIVLLTGQPKKGYSELQTLQELGNASRYISKLALTPSTSGDIIGSCLWQAKLHKQLVMYKNNLQKICFAVPLIFKTYSDDFKGINESVEEVLENILLETKNIFNADDIFLLLEYKIMEQRTGSEKYTPIYKGIGEYTDKMADTDRITDAEMLLDQYSELRNGKDLDIKGNIACMSIVKNFDKEESKNPFIGSLYIKSSQSLETDEYKDILKVFREIVTLAIINTILNKELKLNKELLAKSLESVLKSQEEAIKGVVMSIGFRDKYTGSHVERVANLCYTVGEAMGLSKSDLELLLGGALCHDVGKRWTPEEILNKEGGLTKEERAIMEEHPLNGEKILQNLELVKERIPFVKFHHKNFDGTGYPAGYSVSDIEKHIFKLVMVLRVCDSIDAMGSNRPYSGRKSLKAIIYELKKGSGTEFDPEVVKVAVELLENKTIVIPDLPPDEED